MRPRKSYAFAVAAILAVTLSGCSGGGFSGRGLFSGGGSGAVGGTTVDPDRLEAARRQAPVVQERSTIWDLFKATEDPNITIAVNKYLWVASLDILNFLPVQSADPFTGVIVTGYGTPPGGGRAYRATIFVQDPALDARGLKIAMHTRGGPVNAATIRSVEDAILTRARQLRANDSRL